MLDTGLPLWLYPITYILGYVMESFFNKNKHICIAWMTTIHYYLDDIVILLRATGPYQQIVLQDLLSSALREMVRNYYIYSNICCRYEYTLHYMQWSVVSSYMTQLDAYHVVVLNYFYLCINITISTLMIRSTVCRKNM